MKRGLIVFIAFVTGGISGGVGTWLFLRKKYQDKADAEIESVKAEFKKKYKASKDIPDPEKPAPVPEDEKKENKTEAMKEYEELANKYSGQVNNPKTYEIITPQQFEESSLPSKTIDYFVDGVLAFHGSDKQLTRKDIQLYIGPDALNSIGKFEEDAIHVRNNRLRTDYEVLKQPISYQEALANGKH